MAPVSQFKFACPVCGQHLQARPEEAGHRTECPSCFKGLIVPQAPTEGGGKLLITAALADTRRVPVPPRPERDARSDRPVSAKGPLIYVFLALVAVAMAAVGLILISGDGSGRNDRSAGGGWTDRPQELALTDTPAVGRLNGWDFKVTSAIWRDTKLILRQNDGQPEGLRVQMTFPLQGGELVPGKSFRVGPDQPPVDLPVKVIWKGQDGKMRSMTVPEGYLLWIQFDTVSKTTVSGRLHLCLPDPARSWVAGSFSAPNRTRID